MTDDDENQYQGEDPQSEDSSSEDTSSESDKKDSGPSDEDILEEARERFRLCEEAESEDRNRAIEDLRFLAGDQWDPRILSDRSTAGRPIVTINRLPGFVHQLTNEQRQNRPAIKVSPVNDEGDVDLAKVEQGLIRHIEYDSSADIAYDNAFEGLVASGRGFWRIVTEYVSPISFNQKISIKQIQNRFSVFLDKDYQEPDGSDAKYGFISEDMSKSEFKATFPKAKICEPGNEDWEALGMSYPRWASKDSVRVTEYFYTRYEKTELVLLSDGSVFKTKELPEKLPEGITEEKRRTAMIPQIKWCKIVCNEILEKSDWLGKFVPIIPAAGDLSIIDGKKIFKGIVRDAKDPQRLLNYWAANETETIALAPKAPYIAAEGQIEDYKQFWDTANQNNYAYLPYKPTSHEGQAVPPPQRNAFEPPIQAITQARMQSAEDLKAVTGIYDASLGNRSNEQSGRAIERRNQQSQTSNFHFSDNMARSIRHSGRVILDLIPSVYDTERAERIIGEDGESEIVWLNKIFNHKGKEAHFDTGVGEFDITISTGPSYATKRQEAVASMLDLTKIYPAIAQTCGDLLVKNMDWPGAQEFSDRLRKMLPPGIANDQNKAPLPPEVQQKLQSLNQMVDQLSQALHAQTDIVDKKKVEADSRERIEMAKIQANLEIEMARLGSKEGMALLEHQINEISRRLDMNHEINQQTEAGFNQAAPPQIQQQPQPTGGIPPGTSMGGTP